MGQIESQLQGDGKDPSARHFPPSFTCVYPPPPNPTHPSRIPTKNGRKKEKGCRGSEHYSAVLRSARPAHNHPQLTGDKCTGCQHTVWCFTALVISASEFRPCPWLAPRRYPKGCDSLLLSVVPAPSVTILCRGFARTLIYIDIRTWSFPLPLSLLPPKTISYKIVLHLGQNLCINKITELFGRFVNFVVLGNAINRNFATTLS